MAELSSRKLELLKSIAEYRVLLTAQVALLNGTRQRAAEKATQMLRHQGYLTFSHYEFEGNRGRPRGVCSLTERGAEILKRDGLIDAEIANHRMTGEEIVHVSHELLINWFRIHLLQLDIHIPDLHTEFISATTPFQPLNENARSGPFGPALGTVLSTPSPIVRRPSSPRTVGPWTGTTRC